jgi:YD repeat-containing protein
LTVGGAPFSKSWTYDAVGFQTAETTYGIKTTFTKDARGNIASSRTATNKVTEFTYDFGMPATIKTPEYTITRQINSDGSIFSETRAGRTTTFDYDDAGRLKEIQPPGANLTQITYGSAGEEILTERPASTTTPNPRTIETLDGFGRTIKVAKKVGAATDVLTETKYDEEGRVVEQTHHYIDGAASGGTPKWTVFTYDVLGRITKIAHPPDGTTFATRSYGADGDVTLVNERGMTTIQVWRAVGNPNAARLVGLQDANGKYWDYTYHPLGNLTSVTSQAEAGGPSALTRSWTYDSRNLLAAESHPELGSTSQAGNVVYVYDDAGVLIKKTDAKGKHTTFEYDGNDRVKKISADGQVTLITYEPGSDNRKSALKAGAGAYWFYDQAGRIQSRVDAISGKLFTTSFEYDEFDTLRAIQHPSGRKIQYDVDAAGRPTRIFELAAPREYATGITYHPSGGVASYLSNGITTSIEYDPNRYRVSSIASGELQLTYSDYDAAGNPIAIGDSRTDYSQAFAYDDLDRLTAAAGKYGTVEYAYNLHGNRVTNQYSTYQYETNKLRLANQNGTTFSYDLNGNTLTAGNATFTYTPQNQIETASVPGSVTTYAYDADDQRVKKTSGTETSYYIRGPGGELLTEWSNPGTATGRARDYIYLGSRLLSAVSRNRTDDPAGSIPVPPTPSHKYATSWQVPTGAGGIAYLAGAQSASARRSSHPDMPGAGLRLGQQAGIMDHIENGPLFDYSTSLDLPRQSGFFVEFEIERYPFSAEGEWLAVDGNANTGSFAQGDDLRLYMNSSGQLILKHDGGRPVPVVLWTSAPLSLLTPHTLELRSAFSSTSSGYLPPNPAWENLNSWVQVILDGGQPISVHGGSGWSSNENSPLGLDRVSGEGVFQRMKLISPAGTNGLLMNVWRAGLTTAKNHTDPLETYGSSWRTTLLQADGAGTYSQWTGGQPDWRARSIIAGSSAYGHSVTTSVTGQKVSYRIESMLSRGITGNIGTVLVGVRMEQATTNTRAFIRRNDVETLLNDFTLTNGTRWYRVAESGWLPSDVVEVGVTSGDTGCCTRLSSVAVIVEHDTLAPEPTTDTSVRVQTVTYVGNGGAQTIDFGVDQVPTVLFVIPVNSSIGPEPLAWWDARQGAAPLSRSITSFNLVWPQKGKIHVVHPSTASQSYNTNGVSYLAIALFDPSSRYVLPFAVGKPTAEDNYNHSLRYPHTGALASTFSPDFVFGGAAFTSNQDQSQATFYRGPGHTGDLTGKLSGGASEANRIQSIGTGTVQFGTTVGWGNGDYAYFAGRVSDGVSATKLMAVTSYVGNGAASRNIALDLGGQSPVLTFVVPTTSASKIYRVTGDTKGRVSTGGTEVPNSISAMAANQITVGTALNATGVTYDVWAITTGTVTPW